MSILLSERPSRETPASTPVGPEQGVIEEARRRQHRRRLWISLVALLSLASAGILIAATTSGTPPREAPLHLPPEPSPLSPRHAGSTSQPLSVSLSPNLEGGQAGWCVTIREGSGATGTCGPLPTFDHPLLTSGSGWTHGDRDITTTEIVAPRVVYFLVNGTRRVATKPLPGVPYGLRIAIIHTPLRGSPPWLAARDAAARLMGTRYAPLPPSRMARLAARTATVRLAVAASHFRSPTVVPLDARDKPITESPDHGATWFRDWNPPATPLAGPCPLHVSGLGGAVAKWGQVATAIRPYPARIVGRGFLSCVDTEYHLPGGAGLRASVLLDAADPGRVAPAAIPGLQPIPQVPGLYNATTGYGLAQPMTAKREGNAWIIVAGGGRNAEEARIRLLRHLTATLPS